MNMNEQQKGVLILLAILLACSTSIYLIIINILHPIAFLFVLFGCYPWCKVIWDTYNREKHRPTRILKKILPKFGFSIENTEWHKEDNLMRIFGVYQDDRFIIDASPECLYINIYDLAWHSIKSTDPSMRQYLEALNDTNAVHPNMSVIMGDPDENDMRDIFTASKTLIPEFQPHIYLESLMCDMLNCKRTFIENVQKDRPWLKAKRGPIGFNTSNEQETPAKTKVTGFAAHAE